MFDVIPDGTYAATILNVTSRAVTTVNGPRVVLDVTYVLQVPGFTAHTLCQGLLLDTTADGEPDMDEGKNVELKRIRAAVGQTEPPWSIKMLKGAGPLKIRVELRAAEGSPDVIFHDVGVA